MGISNINKIRSDRIIIGLPQPNRSLSNKQILDPYNIAITMES
jgi:hypothetical protein